MRGHRGAFGVDKNHQVKTGTQKRILFLQLRLPSSETGCGDSPGIQALAFRPPARSLAPFASEDDLELAPKGWARRAKTGGWGPHGPRDAGGADGVAVSRKGGLPWTNGGYLDRVMIMEGNMIGLLNGRTACDYCWYFWGYTARGLLASFHTLGLRASIHPRGVVCGEGMPGPNSRHGELHDFSSPGPRFDTQQRRRRCQPLWARPTTPSENTFAV